MRRSIMLLAALSLVLAACGDASSASASGTSETPAPQGTGATGSPDAGPATTAARADTTPDPPEAVTTTTVDDRPLAPDFSLELGSGGTFVLSEEARPVYLVFWAEW